MLRVSDLTARYGTSQVLFGMTFEAARGECITLLGRNGMGKSTTVRSLLGMLRTREGSVEFDGRAIGGWPSYRIAQAGIGLVPEMRQIFPTLTVRENLTLGMKRGGTGRWSQDDVFALFPMLRERVDAPGGVLSGGEQQLLTICRTLMGNPDLIMVDEPTEGLAPMVVDRVRGLLGTIASRGVAILLIEQKLTIALAISHRLYVMGQGRIMFEGTAEQLRNNEAVRKEWLEI